MNCDFDAIADRLFLKVKHEYPGLFPWECKEVGVHLYEVLVENPIDNKWVVLTYMKNADNKFSPIGVRDLENKDDF